MDAFCPGDAGDEEGEVLVTSEVGGVGDCAENVVGGDLITEGAGVLAGDFGD